MQLQTLTIVFSSLLKNRNCFGVNQGFFSLVTSYNVYVQLHFNYLMWSHCSLKGTSFWFTKLSLSIIVQIFILFPQYQIILYFWRHIQKSGIKQYQHIISLEMSNMSMPNFKTLPLYQESYKGGGWTVWPTLVNRQVSGI